VDGIEGYHYPGSKIVNGADIRAKAVVPREVAIYVIVADNPAREMPLRTCAVNTRRTRTFH